MGKLVDARIHSKDGNFDKVEIISEKGPNNVVVKYNEKYYTAVFNVFVGCYYVDDKYGEITDYNNHYKY